MCIAASSQSHCECESCLSEETLKVLLQLQLNQNHQAFWMMASPSCDLRKQLEAVSTVADQLHAAALLTRDINRRYKYYFYKYLGQLCHGKEILTWITKNKIQKSERKGLFLLMFDSSQSSAAHSTPKEKPSCLN
ncbi:nuclear pore complex protein [Sarotherodon galilaeus]